MEKMKLGEFFKQKGNFKAFIPYSFPPLPGFKFDQEILKKNDRATYLLGKLDGITKLLPDLDFFLLMYLRKDAASSSQIEGTRATMVDAIAAEAKIDRNIPDDVSDIIHYIKALNYGLRRVVGDNFPLTLRFIRELHQQLLQTARVSHFSDPGEFRQSQNWIGGTSPDNAQFVPPPVADMNQALKDLEKFIHQPDCVPIIIKAGIIHAQFETIHPFLDGNGRTGRMLITFYLWQSGYLDQPVLFLSAFFKKHRKLYYDRLFGYHHGEVSAWINFFLDGVIEISQEAIDIVAKITTLREKDSYKINKLGKRAAETAVLVMQKLYAQPLVNLSLVQKWTGFTRAGAQTVIDRFIKLGILSPAVKGKKYGRSYVYKEYLEIFNR